MKAAGTLTLKENRRLADTLFLATFAVEAAHRPLLAGVRAGQFLMLRCDPSDPWRFQRPFSFVSVNPEAGELSIYYRAVGDQTRKLASTLAGTQLPALFPLGNTFTAPEKDEQAVLVAGGIGVAPLLMLATELAASGNPLPRLYFGARCEPELTRGYVEQFPAETHFATDDGSHGHHGTVVDLLKADGVPPEARVYACGPKAMLRALKASLPREQRVEASLEEVMACGLGACYGCAVRTDGLGADEMKLVCRDGPVFNLHRVVFD